MKKVIKLGLLAAIALNMSACAITEDINERCGGSDLESFCHFVFGATDSEQQTQIDKGVQEAEFALNARVKTIEMLISFLNAAREAQQQDISHLEFELSLALDSVVQLQSDLTELATGDTVVQMIDPCGAAPGYNEVLLRTGSGKNVAYFEAGSKRFLSVIGQGSYATTDNSACSFTVDSLGQVCSVKNSVMVCE